MPEKRLILWFEFIRYLVGCAVFFQKNYAGFTLVRLLGELHQFKYG